MPSESHTLVLAAASWCLLLSLIGIYGVQVETFRLHEYVTQKSWSGRPNGASLQQLMDSLAGLQSTLKLLQESSKALLQVSLQAEQVSMASGIEFCIHYLGSVSHLTYQCSGHC